jgi:hypothetical protein
MNEIKVCDHGGGEIYLNVESGIFLGYFGSSTVRAASLAGLKRKIAAKKLAVIRDLSVEGKHIVFNSYDSDLDHDRWRCGVLTGDEKRGYGGDQYLVAVTGAKAPEWLHERDMYFGSEQDAAKLNAAEKAVDDAENNLDRLLCSLVKMSGWKK